MDKSIISTVEPFFFPGGKTGCVLVHGFTGSSKEMQMMGNYLNSKGVTVVGIRLAGHTTKISNMVHTRWKDWLTSVEISVLKPYIEKEYSNTVDQISSKDHVDYSAYLARSIAELDKLIDILHSNLYKIHTPVLLINSKKTRRHHYPIWNIIAMKFLRTLRNDYS